MTEKLKVLDLFSGLGAFSLGLQRTRGFRTAAFCEIDPYARRILAQQWPETRIYEDVRTLSAVRIHEDVGPIDVICGGFPCQDASIANIDGAGTAGDRTGLFSEIVRLARELDVSLVLMENVPELLNRGFGDVLGALAEIGFDAEWEIISARELGFDHQRERLFIAAYPGGAGWKGSVPYEGILERTKASFTKPCHAGPRARNTLGRGGVDLRGRYGATVAMERRRLHAIGNAVVPQKITAIGHAILESRRSTPPQDNLATREAEHVRND